MADEDQDVNKPSDSSDEGNSPQEGDESDADQDSDNKVPYSRFKEVNEEKKELQGKLEEMKNEISPEEEGESDEEESSSKLDVDTFVEMKEATEGLDADEINQLKSLAEVEEKSLKEMRENENFKIWLEAKRERSKKDKQTPEPDTRKPPEEKEPEDYTEEDLKGLSNDELLEFVNEEKKRRMWT